MDDIGSREIPTLHELVQRGLTPSVDPLAPKIPAPGYGELYDVLIRAHNQAAYGKGHERHATGQPFVEQPIVKLTELYGPGFPLGQAGKKMQESLRLPKERAVHELLGAINYIAAQIIVLEKED